MIFSVVFFRIFHYLFLRSLDNRLRVYCIIYRRQYRNRLFSHTTKLVTKVGKQSNGMRMMGRRFTKTVRRITHIIMFRVLSSWVSWDNLARLTTQIGQTSVIMRSLSSFKIRSTAWILYKRSFKRAQAFVVIYHVPIGTERKKNYKFILFFNSSRWRKENASNCARSRGHRGPCVQKCGVTVFSGC